MNNPRGIFLIFLHVALICLSNILVQHPVMIAGFRTTWGSFSYPLIFILTDLTTRLLGASLARKIVYSAMLPGLVLSFFMANWFNHISLLTADSVAFRIALASFCAYVLGQLLDILFFQKLKKKKQWWVAPSVATTFGNILDTYCFFFIAFFHGTNLFLSSHWLEIATVDLVFKLLISVGSMLPLYGLILASILRYRSGLVRI